MDAYKENYRKMPSQALREALGDVHLHLEVMSTNFRANNISNPNEAEKYDKYSIPRTQELTSRMVGIIEVLRERNEPVQFFRPVQFHPIIEAVLISKFRKSNDPLLRKSMAHLEPRSPEGLHGGGRRRRGKP